MSEVAQQLAALSTHRFRPYPVYKPSGIDWLGDVPEHWEVKRSDRFVATERHQIEPQEFAGREVFHYSIPVVQETGNSLQSELTGMVRLATSDFPEILEDYLAISRKRRRNWTALSRLQMHLMEELLVQEGAVKHYKERLRQLGDDPDVELTPDAPSPDINFARAQLFFHRLYASACRAIGDGIAWRAL